MSCLDSGRDGDAVDTTNGDMDRNARNDHAHRNCGHGRNADGTDRNCAVSGDGNCNSR